MLAGSGHRGKVHLFLVRKRKPKGRKTPIYKVMKEHERGMFLGEIRWYGAFSQFVFYPDNDTMWSRGCLEIVNEFLKMVSDRYRRRNIIGRNKLCKKRR